MATRAGLVAMATGALMATVAILAARGMPPIVTSSDLAVTEFYTELATRAQILVGPDSRFAWNHPGPVYFYLLAPLYAAAGHQAAVLFTAAVAINLAAVLTLAWVVSRNDRGPLLVLLTVACLVFTWRIPRLLASPWTAHVPVLTSLTFVVLCGAVLGGRHRMLPLLILFGSFVTQTHLSYVPMVGVLALVAVGAVVARHRRRAASILGVSAAIWLVLWLPTLIEASTHRGGNIAALWRFFVANAGPSHPFTESIATWSYALCGILRADLALPWGGHFDLLHAWWRVPLAIAQVVALGFVAWNSRHRRPFEAGLAASAALASVVGLWAITRIHGDIVDHEFFGLVALGTLNLAILGSCALRLIWPKTWPRREQAAVGACMAALIGCTVVGVQHLRVFTSFEVRRADTPRIPATYELLRNFLRERGIHRPLFVTDGDAASDATGIVLRFLQAGQPFAVEELHTSLFTPAFAKNGLEDALVNLSGREGTHLAIAARPGNVVIRDRHPLYVDVLVR